MTLSQDEIRRRVDPSRFCYAPLPSLSHANSKTGEDKRPNSRGICDGRPSKVAILRIRRLPWGLAWAVPLLVLLAAWRVFVELGPHASLQRVYSLSPTSLSSVAVSTYTPITREEPYNVVQGLKDYALASNGAVVACPFTSGCEKHADIHTGDGHPSLSIADSLRAGDCWNVSSRSAQLGVLLQQHIQPRYFGLDHALKHRIGLPEAPRNVTMWGVVDGLKPRRALRDKIQSANSVLSIASSTPVVLVATMYYSIHNPATTQTFPALDYIQESKADFSMFIFQIMDNWGSPSTCLYKVRVYGEPTPMRKWFTAR